MRRTFTSLALALLILLSTVTIMAPPRAQAALDVLDCQYGHYIRKIGNRLPDLAFQEVGFDRSDPFLEDGDVIRFSAVIVNQGDADTHDFRVEVHLDGRLHDSGNLSLGAHQSDTLWTLWTATEGTHTITWIADTTNVVAESNEANNEASRTFRVGPPFDFDIRAEPSSLTVEKGESATFTVTVTSLSSSRQTVILSVTGYHETMSYPLNPTSGNPTFSSTLAIATSDSTPVGTYTLTITGRDGGKTHSTTVILTVIQPPTQLILVGGVIAVIAAIVVVAALYRKKTRTS